MHCEGEKRGSSATDQNTALRVRASRLEGWIKHVDKQVRKEGKPEKLAGDEGQKTCVNIFMVFRLVIVDKIHADFLK